ncbi:unnamed protein product [Prorocentrum cordatum]|uniref:Uncharacterized protein n=1 Tax=Prorocentrum cordatum TaxID=2364126 RepID=A0ABN9UWN4_9DINO|nr:unnamed protein product [Polarella glacialis]
MAHALARVPLVEIAFRKSPGMPSLPHALLHFIRSAASITSSCSICQVQWRAGAKGRLQHRRGVPFCPLHLRQDLRQRVRAGLGSGTSTQSSHLVPFARRQEVFQPLRPARLHGALPRRSSSACLRPGCRTPMASLRFSASDMVRSEIQGFNGEVAQEVARRLGVFYVATAAVPM